MSSKSETGHTKNVSNLKTLNGYLASLGAQYNPTKISIVLAQLQALHTNAEKALSDIQTLFSQQRISQICVWAQDVALIIKSIYTTSRTGDVVVKMRHR